eukprot:2373933-Pyramimonas_sp.AAC.1
MVVKLMQASVARTVTIKSCRAYIRGGTLQSSCTSPSVPGLSPRSLEPAYSLSPRAIGLRSE